jgi:uncharacterized membrane protein YfcA
MAHWHRKNVDIKMGTYLLIGGLLGAVIGVWLFSILKQLGQIDLAISLIYVIFLGTIGTFMAIESSKTIFKQSRGIISAPEKGRFLTWLHALPLPLRTHFPRSDLEISGVLPILVGVIAGIMVALMGIGGGFVTIPAMIYILRMPTSVVVGTSLYQIIFTTSLVTVLHATSTQSVDIVLAALLIVGGVIGAQFGTIIGLKLRAEKLRILLALMVLGVCIKLALGLFIEPDDLYSIVEIIK